MSEEFDASKLTDALYGGSDSTASGEEGTLAWLDKQCK